MMPRIKYDRFWHGSRPAYYFRKAKHIVSRPFYPLMRWKDYGHNDQGENDPAWEAKLGAMASQQNLPTISVTDIDSSCFPCVDQILSEAASQRESSSISTTSCSWRTIAGLEDTQVPSELKDDPVHSKLKPASQSMASIAQPKFLPTAAELDDHISRWLDPNDPAKPTAEFRKACPVANFHLMKMTSRNCQSDQVFCQNYVKARSTLVEALIADRTGEKMILNNELESTLAQLKNWFESDSYAHLLKLWPLCHSDLGAWCAGMNAYVHQPYLFVVRLPNRGGRRSRSGPGCRSRRINSLYSGGMMTRMGRRALGLCRARRFARR